MKISLTHIKLFLIFLVLLPWHTSAQDEDVMLQAFDWNVQNQPPGQTWYDIVTQNTATLADAGVDLIWLPPPSDSAAPQGYLPRELYNFNSAYGSEIALRNLITQMHASDIKVISDIVINHRVGTSDAVTFTNPSWPTFYITADDEGRNFVNGPVNFSINNDFFPGNSLKSDGSSGGFAAARDLDHENPEVRQEIITWMNFLKNDIGFDGWRYDFVHGYNPLFNKEYNDATNPYFAVGELLESSRVQTNNFVNWTQGSSSAFDFNTKVSLQNALRDNNLSYLRDSSGNASGMIGINPSKSVTFLDNHDTGAAQQCCGSSFVFPSGEANLRKGYAYILTHPGNPMVFWTHFFDTGSGVQNAIKDLIAIRKDVRLFAGSSMNIVEARNDLYAAYIDGRNGTVAMKLGSADWSPNGSGWTLRTSGQDYAVWTQGGTDDNGNDETVAPFTVNFKKPSGWNNSINVYFYDAEANSTIPNTAPWPGEQTSNLSGSQWFSYTLTPPSGVQAENIRLIFNDGANQTANLSRSTDGWYTNTTWSDTCPSDCPGTSTSSDVTLRFLRPNGWGNTTNLYLYNKSTNQTLSGTTQWPGQTMSNLSGTAWSEQSFTLPNGVRATDVGVVFNAGNGQQTVDLTRGTDGWFTVTGSSNGKRTGIWSNSCTTNCPSRALVNTTSTSTLEGNRLSDSTLKLWPNPIKDEAQLAIDVPTDGVLEISFLTITGQAKTVYSQRIKSGSQVIPMNTSKLGASGIYFCVVKLDGKPIQKPLKVIRK